MLQDSPLFEHVWDHNMIIWWKTRVKVTWCKTIGTTSRVIHCHRKENEGREREKELIKKNEQVRWENTRLRAKLETNTNSLPSIIQED